MPRGRNRGRTRESQLWTPAALNTADICFWYDMADPTAFRVEGQGVSWLRNKFGNSGNATQTTDALRVPYSDGCAASRGKPCMLWPDTANAYTLEMAAWSGSNWTALFAAIGYRDGTIWSFDDNCHVLGNATTEGVARLFGTSGSSQWGTTSQSSNGRRKNGRVASNSTALAFPFGIMRWSINNNTKPTRLGWGYGSGNRGWRGPMSELIATRNTSKHGVLMIEGYLCHKWGVVDQLRADHPFKFFPPLMSHQGVRY